MYLYFVYFVRLFYNANICELKRQQRREKNTHKCKQLIKNVHYIYDKCTNSVVNSYTYVCKLVLSAPFEVSLNHFISST